MRLPVKFLDESGGRTAASSGGSESLGPPIGGIILAQPVPLSMPATAIKAINNKKRKLLCFMLLCKNSGCKHKPFMDNDLLVFR